jgi:hypothetical protein
MRKELDEELCRKYPKIFRDRHAPMNQTCMCWGFAHGDGWYNIIDTLCANIQSHIDWSRRKRVDALLFNRALGRAMREDFTLFQKLPSWKQKRLHEELESPEPQCMIVPESIPQVVAVQVKEKFGTLRFYYDGGDDKIDGMVSMAESMSATMCEECGAPGKATQGGWIRTLCEEHTKKTS